MEAPHVEKVVKIMDLRPTNCDRCNDLLDEDNTFRIRIGDWPTRFFCADCHKDYIRMLEKLFSSRSIIGGRDQRGMVKAQVKWFNVPKIQRLERLARGQ